MRKHFLIAILFFLLFTFIHPNFVQAFSQYDIFHSTTYTITTTRQVLVKHLIKITNKSSLIYPTSYNLNIATNTIKNLQVKEDDLPISAKIHSTSNTTNITVQFRHPNPGKDKTKTLLISYHNPSLLISNTTSGEINIPHLINQNQITHYVRQLIVPNNFLSPTYFTPTPTTASHSATLTTYTWQNNPSQSISVLFGTHQAYQLTLQYQLINPAFNSTYKEIALPPDTNYQRVFIQSLQPQPLKITTDSDGNWLAQYPLKSQETKKITARLIVVVYPRPTLKLPFTPDFDKLTQPTQYWDTSTTLIKQLTSQLTTPKSIYSYLVNNFVYNYQKASSQPRLGANQALNHPTSATCTEFTDAFITLARALNIPAREIEGYALTNNPQLKPLSLKQDILHAWPEYYDSQTHTWYQIDPTWANTTGGINYFDKLDFNHLTFVKHGSNDSYPLPAGAYKIDTNAKTIQVQPIDKLPSPQIKIDITTTATHFLIRNLGNSSLINHNVTLPNQQTHHINYLPPYGLIKIPITSPSIPSHISKILPFFIPLPFFLTLLFLLYKRLVS